MYVNKIFYQPMMITLGKTALKKMEQSRTSWERKGI
jgi:hypothetical protein